MSLLPTLFKFNDITSFFRDIDETLRFPDFKNLDDLKSKGEVTRETEERGDMTIRREAFHAADGSVHIYRETARSKNYEKFEKLSELRTKINRLMRDYKFEEAIPLRDELRKLEHDLSH